MLSASRIGTGRRPLTMHLLDIPPTAFPKLQQLATFHTLSHQCAFEIYSQLAEYVQHVMMMRYGALLAVTNAQTSTEPQLEELILRLKNDDRNYCSLDYHGRIYGLYMLGAHSEASDLLERFFLLRNVSTVEKLDALKMQLKVIEARIEIEKMLLACSVRSAYQTQVRTRVKSSASLWAKLIMIGVIDPFEVVESSIPRSITLDVMPYDLIGGEITVTTTPHSTFEDFLQFLNGHFSSEGIQLKDQNVYSPDWMRRKSLEGKFLYGGRLIPFQLHVWDQVARRYEFMSYGNYKMNKLFYPPILDWKNYLHIDLPKTQFCSLVISNWQRLFNLG